MKKLAFVAAGFAAIVACDGGTTGETGDTGDTGVTPEDLLIMAFTRDCETDPAPVTGSFWDYTATTNGPSSGALLYVSQDVSGAWEETHDLQGSAESLTVSLSGSNSDSTQIQNETTAFSCTMEPEMVFLVALYDPVDTSALADCAYFTGGNATALDVLDSSSISGVNPASCSDGDAWM